MLICGTGTFAPELHQLSASPPNSDATVKLIFPLTTEGLLSVLCVLEPLGVQTNKVLANTSTWTGSDCIDLGVDELWDGLGWRGWVGLGSGSRLPHSPIGHVGREAFSCLYFFFNPALGLVDWLL